MEYNKIPSILKRFSFFDKMHMAQIYSRHLMRPKGVDFKVVRRSPPPWSIETFVLFAVVSKEWRAGDFRNKEEKLFQQIIGCITEYIHPAMKEHKRSTFARYLMQAELPSQIDIQEPYLYKLFRYSEYFGYKGSKIDMQQVFQLNFGCKYHDYLVVAVFLWLAFSSQSSTLQNIINCLQSKYAYVFQHLQITRQGYINELELITSNIADYKYCIRPSYKYPIIEDNNTLFFPLPHLLMHAVTSSLLYRITENNNQLMTVIGKEVFEPYLLSIIQESNIFDEVVSEKEYTEGGTNKRTLDVLARKGNNYVFFESKSFSPKANLRILSEDSYSYDVDRLASSIIQVYKHIHNLSSKDYCFFLSTQRSIWRTSMV